MSSILSAVNNCEEQYGQVQLMLHFNSVEKGFHVPGRHMQELLDVYGLLQQLRHPGTIQCASMHVSTHFACEQPLQKVCMQYVYNP